MIFGSRVQTGLPQLPEGVPPELYSNFLTIYNSIHNLARQIATYAGVDEQPSDIWSQLSVDDTLIVGNMNRWYVKQNEALLFGQVVAPVLVGAELRVRKANATNNTKWACGIVSSSDHVSGADNFCEVRVGNWFCDGIAGLTPGARYWLSTVDGLITNVAPVAAGNIEQYIGWAVAGNRLLVDISGNYIQH